MKILIDMNLSPDWVGVLGKHVSRLFTGQQSETLVLKTLY